MKNRHIVTFISTLVLGLCVLIQAQAQPYPNKPVRLIIPFPPGGTTDVVARLITTRVGAMWGGQAIILDYRAGASGLIGATAGVRAAPDGYVLTLGNNQSHASNASLYSNLGFDMIKDVQPVAMLARSRHVVVVPANSPYRTIKELISGGQTKPLNYASSSPGSSSHMVSEMFRLQTRMQGVHIPYKGAAAAVVDVIAGHVDFMTASYGSAAGHIQSGKLRALMISGEQREPKLPNLPTFAEEGYEALAADVWVGLFAPAGTPRTIVQQWSDALAKVMAQSDIKERFEAAGFDPWYKAVQEMEQFHSSEVLRWGKMVRDTGVKVE